MTFPLSFLLIFTAWSLGINKTPSILSAALPVFASNLDRVAPSGVQVQDSNVQLLTLASGKNTLLITGNVTNLTNVIVKNIKLETSLFDQSNNKMARLITYAYNNLPYGEEINLLSSDEINKRQQSTVESKDGGIIPGEKIPFQIIVTDIPPGTKWYATQSYSIKAEL